jgi:(p)ppGpp synthase/HD superfamily hydrolase
MANLEQTYRPLLEAISFASRAHQGQVRKDRRTPYASHPFRVCLIVRQVFGFDDPTMLSVAALHDTIEDTTTDFDDLAEHFSPEVARWVALLSKDKRQEDGPREEQYRATLASAPWQVKVCKLGDIFDNLMDSQHLSAEQRQRSLTRSHGYLEVLDDPGLPPQARQALETVRQLLEEMSR